MSRDNFVKLFRGADILCIALTVALSALFLILSQAILQTNDETVLKLTSNGETDFYSLSSDQTIEINSHGYTLTVRISAGAAYVEHSTCPDGVCKAMGKISKNGQIAVCAPAQVAISIENAAEGEVSADAITR